jgi:pyruvate carboxylase
LKPANIEPEVPKITANIDKKTNKPLPPKGWRDIYLNEGASKFAKAVRDHTKSTNSLLLMDTTMRGNFFII